VKKIPIEGLEMADIKNDAVPLSDGPLINRSRLDQGEKIIGALTRIHQLLDKIVPGNNIALRGWHANLQNDSEAGGSPNDHSFQILCSGPY
jgi:hypothetical protein